MSRVIYSTSTSSSALNYKRLKIKIIITNLQNYELEIKIWLKLIKYIKNWSVKTKLKSKNWKINTEYIIYQKLGANKQTKSQTYYQHTKLLNNKLDNKYIMKCL